ncbi:MAG: hypothetical protein AB1511_00030 [Deinococcota bacterium]
MHKLGLSLLVLTATFALTACGSGGTAPNPNPDPAPNPAPANGTTLTRAQIAGCPDVSGSSDIAASACLKGSVVGKTLSGDTCTLTIKDGGSYAYASQKLKYSYANASSNFNFFAYSRSTDYLLWGTHSADYTVSLEVKYNEQQAHKMQIDVENNKVTETCIAQL